MKRLTFALLSLLLFASSADAQVRRGNVGVVRQRVVQRGAVIQRRAVVRPQPRAVRRPVGPIRRALRRIF